MNWFFLVQFSLVGNREIPSEKNWQGGRWRHCCSNLLIELVIRESKIDISRGSGFVGIAGFRPQNWERRGGREGGIDVGGCCLEVVSCWDVEQWEGCGKGG